MKIKAVKTTIIEIDVDAERKRIADCDFEPHQEANLLKLCAMFERGEFAECRTFIGTWGTDQELECQEAEFVNLEMWDVIAMHYYGDNVVTVEKDLP